MNLIAGGLNESPLVKEVVQRPPPPRGGYILAFGEFRSSSGRIMTPSGLVWLLWSRLARDNARLAPSSQLFPAAKSWSGRPLGRLDFTKRSPLERDRLGGHSARLQNATATEMTSQGRSRARRRRRRHSQSASSNRKPRRFAVLESSVSRAGALAAAVLSVLAVVFFATDRLSFLHHHPAPQRGAVFSALTVSDPLTLAEFDERTHLSPARLRIPLPQAEVAGNVASPRYVSDDKSSSVARLLTADITGPSAPDSTTLLNTSIPSTTATTETTSTSTSTTTTSTAPTSTTTSSTAPTSTTPTSTSPTSSTTTTTSTSGPSCAPGTSTTTSTAATTNTTCTTTTSNGASGPPGLSLAPMFTGPASHVAADAVTLAKLRGFLAGKAFAPGSGLTNGLQGPISTEVKVLCVSGIFSGDSEGCPNNVVSLPGRGGSSGGGGNPGGSGSPGGGGNPGGGPRTNGTRGGFISEGAAQAILAVFGQTRTRDRQPLGVIVSYDVTVTGFVGQRVVVRWTLWSAHHGSGSMTELPEQWLQNRPIETLIGQAVSDTASPEFWVPIPKQPGPFQVEVSAYDGSGVRLTDKLSQPFG